MKYGLWSLQTGGIRLERASPLWCNSGGRRRFRVAIGCLVVGSILKVNQLICQNREEDFFQILCVSQKVRTLSSCHNYFWYLANIYLLDVITTTKKLSIFFKTSFLIYFYIKMAPTIVEEGFVKNCHFLFQVWERPKGCLILE